VKLVVGLGNPGRRYAATRHNVGFRIVERFAEDHGIALTGRRFEGRFGRGSVERPGGEALDVAVLEPQTYMNRSGDSVCDALRFLPVEDPGRDLIVAFDDVDLPFGRLRLRPRGGAAGHQGLSHIIDRLGRNDFPRLRFGVGRSPVAMDTADYVLQRFSSEEEAAVEDRIAEAARAIRATWVDGLVAAMNRYNRDPEAARAPDALEGANGTE
jgi:PTH1 family peptidyl-tRNA hydrolase